MPKKISSIIVVFFLILSSCTPTLHTIDSRGDFNNRERASVEIENVFASSIPSAEIKDKSEEKGISESMENAMLLKKSNEKTDIKIRNRNKPVIKLKSAKSKSDTISDSIKDNPPEKKINKKALSGFIFSSIGWSLSYLGLIFITIGFVKGIIALKEFRKTPEIYKRKGFAIASVIMGAVYYFILLLVLIILFSPLLSEHNYLK